MRYQKFTSNNKLHPFVECYFVWEGDAPELVEVQSPPNVFCSMVFNYADPYEVSQNLGEFKVLPLAFASGQLTSNYTLRLKGKIGMIGVVFRASAFHNFFNVRMSNLVNTRMDLSLVLGDEAEKIWTAIKEKDSDLGRVAIIEEFLLSHLQTAKSRLSIIDEAVEFIDEKRGKVTVDEVANDLKISRRYLEKKFLEKVGVSPKFYARLKRFTTLSIQIPYSDKIDWQQIVFEYGFHDQSHLVKEFIEFNKMNPSNYFILNRELARFLKK